MSIKEVWHSLFSLANGYDCEFEMVEGEGVGLLRKDRRKTLASIGSVVSNQVAKREYLVHGAEIDLHDWQ